LNYYWFNDNIRARKKGGDLISIENVFVVIFDDLIKK